MPPYADVVLSSLQALARLNHGRPVRTIVLAGLLGISPRTALNYIKVLETRGLVVRLSPRSGWLPAQMAPAVNFTTAALAAGRDRAAARPMRQVQPS